MRTGGSSLSESRKETDHMNTTERDTDHYHITIDDNELDGRALMVPWVKSVMRERI